MKDVFGALMLFVGGVLIVFVTIVLSIFMLLGHGLPAALLVVLSALVLIPLMNFGARLWRAERWKKPLGYTLRLSGWVTLTFCLAFIMMAFSIGLSSVPIENSRSMAVTAGTLIYLVVGIGTAWSGSRLLELERAAHPFKRPTKPPARMSAPDPSNPFYSDGEDEEI